MASEIYSNHYNNIDALGVGYNARSTGVFYAPSGYGKGDLNRIAGLVTVPTGTAIGANNETVAFFRLKSGDRLVELLWSTDANQGATSDWNLGLYKTTADGDLGALVTADTEDLFVFELDCTGVQARVDVLVHSTGNGGSPVIFDVDRGKALWEMVNLISASTYTEDPHETWTFAATSTDAVATTAALHQWLLEAYYVPGG